MKTNVFAAVPIIILISVTAISTGEVTRYAPDVFTNQTLQNADTLYNAQKYSAFLDALNNAKKGATQAPAYRFKRAYALYRTKQYKSSADRFYRLAENDRFLPLYSRFFRIRALWHYNSQKAVQEAKQFVNAFAKRALSDSLTILLADSLFANSTFDQAFEYYQQAYHNKVDRNNNAYFRIRAAKALYLSGKKQEARQYFFQILNRYESDPNTLRFCQWLQENEPDYYREHFFDVVDVYLNNSKPSEIKPRLEAHIKEAGKHDVKEKGRYYLLKLFYREGRYKHALYGFKSLLSSLKNERLEPYIRLYIARSYYRLGNRSQTIKAYLDYAERFPRRRIAPEAVWKSAWIYEELQQPEKALALYKKIRRQWPRSSYAYEAHFREGFTYYRLGQYENADRIFNDIRFRRLSDRHVHRAQYWSALCRAINGDTITARRLRADLANDLWDDYYTMKSYLLHKNYIDSTSNMIRIFKETANPLTFYGTGYVNLLRYFNDAFRIKELLGDGYALAALNDIKLRVDSRQEWIAVGEIYKKFGAYGRAFRVFDYINRRYYKDVSYTQKAFMLKERFPYYYDDIVEKYSRRYLIENELLLALIKQESLFDHQARSWADAYGLMQLILPTARDMARLAGVHLHSAKQLYQPELNIHLGALYLKQLQRRFEGNKYKMLAAYNGGPHRVKRWQELPGSYQMDVFIENIEFSQTRDYVKKVMKNYWAYTLLNNNFTIEQSDVLLGYAE